MILWGTAGGLATLAVAAGFADRRRRTRHDPDRVGLIDWPGVQMATLLALLLVVSLALHA
jgi:hypothetical protein